MVKSQAEEYYDNSEEMELGWLDPATKIPGSAQFGVNERVIWTGYGPDGCQNGQDNIYFLSESELTQFGGVWPGDPWAPVNYDELGRLEGCCRR